MTIELDDYWPPPLVDDAIEQRKPRLHHHHYHRQPDGRYLCFEHAEPVVRDEVAARRGKSARRLGGDTERRIERVYGPVKIGERGDPVDHLGRVWRWQSKATRQLPPRWLALIDRPTKVASIGKALESALKGMEGKYGGRTSVVIRSFVRKGGKAEGRTRDWLFIRGVDGYVHFGIDGPAFEDYWLVIPGDWWLDHFGRDE